MQEFEINFNVGLIRHGRYLLATNQGVASCRILENCQQGPHDVSEIFYFLREQPRLVQAQIFAEENDAGYAVKSIFGLVVVVVSIVVIMH